MEQDLAWHAQGCGQKSCDLHSGMAWRGKKTKYVEMTGPGYRHRAEEPMVTLKHFLPNEDMSAWIQHASDEVVC